MSFRDVFATHILHKLVASRAIQCLLISLVGTDTVLRIRTVTTNQRCCRWTKALGSSTIACVSVVSKSRDMPQTRHFFLRYAAMIDVPLSLFAWMGVVLIQAMVHLAVKARKLPDETKTVGDVSLLAAKATASERATASQVVVLGPPKDFADDTEDSSLDGDEPEMFFQLLEQTGQEMLQSTRSLQELVREQIERE